MKTYMPKAGEIDRKWHLVDLDGLVLGRAAVKVADILRGKNKPIFSPHLDAGDYIVVINASKVRLTGNKALDKKYYRYSGYPGGLKVTTYQKLIENKSPWVFTHAVKGMLPKNRLGRKMIKKLFVYPDEKHKHQAQKPEILNFED